MAASEHIAQIFVFGDQTSSITERLRSLLAIKHDAVLADFFERALFAIRQEIGQLPNEIRSLFPRFTSLESLSHRCRNADIPNPALISALVTIHDLGTFIHHVSSGYTTYPSASNSILVGLCSGLLAASAVSVSRSLEELVPVAVEAVLVSLRVGIKASEIGEGLQRSSSLSGSSKDWSIILALNQQDAETLVKRFSETEESPPSDVLYISATSAKAVTVSGPPDLLSKFKLQFPQLKTLPCPVYAPYHAKHLYSEADVHELLRRSDITILTSHIPRLTVLSNSTGTSITTSTYGELLNVVITDILTRPMRWDAMLNTCTQLTRTTTSKCLVVPITSGPAAKSLVSTLNSNGISTTLDSHSVERKVSCSSQRKEDSKIAIVGYSGRFPEADNPEELWDLLCKGLDVHKEIPKDRWDAHKHYDPTGKRKNTSGVLTGCFIKNPGLFDARFFNMSPREAAQSDPAQRLALMTAYEALEMAGIVPDATPSTQRDRVGVFYGTTSDDYREVNSGQNVDTYFIPGGNRAFVPGRINYHFKFSGPSYSVDTACSSSFAAIHLACNSLWRGETDTAIAGGTNILTNPDNHAGLDRGHFLSRTGNCNTFDDEASGYCRADAVATIVLKRLEDAIADNDTVLGTILGAGTNHSAESVSITRPLADAQIALLEQILTKANVDAADVSAIEMHGTGTQAGDATEMKTVLTTFAPNGAPRRKLPLFLGSVKSNIGHAESASGVASLVKGLLMMRHNAIPPHCGIKTRINRGFPKDLDQRNISITTRQAPWTREIASSDGFRRMFLNNFSAAGGNTAILLEDAEVPLPVEEDQRLIHPVAISAKSASALKSNAKALAAFLEANPQTSLGSLSYTSTARRVHHSYRALVWGKDISSIVNSLHNSTKQDAKSTSKEPQVAFTFTGQGSQYPAMAQGLMIFSMFRNTLLRLDTIAQTQGFPSFLSYISTAGTLPEYHHTSPVIVQLAIVSIEIACAKLWQSWGVTPSAVIGHSLGEFAALNVAGVLSDSAAIYITGKRAILMEQHCRKGSHAMLAVKVGKLALNPRLSGSGCYVSCVNSVNETVVSGTTRDIDALSVQLESSGLKSTKINNLYAFHSAQVDPILDEFENAVRAIPFSSPTIPYISGALAEVIPAGAHFDDGPQYLRHHCRQAVQFPDALEAGVKAKVIDGKTIWVEIGPHPVTAAFIKAHLAPQIAPVATLSRKEDNLVTVSKALTTLYCHGAAINWREYHLDFRKHHRVLHLPAYSWDLSNHWIQYENDWCLSKGDARAMTVSAAQGNTSLMKNKPEFLTSTVHRIIQQRSDTDSTYMLARTDTSSPHFAALLESHKVNGVAMCPSSVYADIALTLASHLLQSCKTSSMNMTSGMDVCDMKVDKALVSQAHGGAKHIQISAAANWISKEAIVEIYSVDDAGTRITTHCKCSVRYSDTKTWISEWKRYEYLIRAQVDKLMNGVKSEAEGYEKIGHGLFYRLFGTLVKYEQCFKGHDEVFLNSTELEATGRVSFKTTETDGTYFRNPCWIDSLGQISGFVMNAADAFDANNLVFINHGWDSMRMAAPLVANKTYRTYVMMQPVGKNIYSGDVYILEERSIIGCYQGVKFQGMPRKVLEMSMAKSAGARMQNKAPSPDMIFEPGDGPRTGTSRLSATSNTSLFESRTAHAVAPARLDLSDVTVIQATSITPKIPKLRLHAEVGIVEKMIKILAEEIGISPGDLKDDEELSDLGVDSLLSLTLTDRLRTELELDIDSTVLANNTTIRDLRGYFAEAATPTVAICSPTALVRRPTFSLSTAVSTPQSEQSSYISGASSTTSISDTSDVDVAIQQYEALVKMIAEEVGIPQDQLDTSEDLSNFGLDSLMSLTVLSRLRDEHSIELDSDFFVPFTSLGAIRTYLCGSTKHTANAVTVANPKPAVPASTSYLLQGGRTCTKALFLFPDGSGSASSYMNLPRVAPDVAIYGLNCPFMKTPTDMAGLSIADMTASYITEIRRRQPHGPYSLGGWSAGGICAYDAAKALVSEDEIVERLILIDSPNPIGLSKLPPRLYDYFSGLGMFNGRATDGGKTKPPSWLLPHFLAFIEALDLYNPTPWPQNVPKPKVFIVWATEGVCGGDKPKPEPRVDDTREMKWLLEDRTEFGGNGWDELFDEEANAEGKGLEIVKIEGVDHFSIVDGVGKGELSRFLAKAMT